MAMQQLLRHQISNFQQSNEYFVSVGYKVPLGKKYYSLRPKILVLEIDKMNVSIIKISLDTIISRTSISGRRDYVPPILLLPALSILLERTARDTPHLLPLARSICDVISCQETRSPRTY